jgi:hypothetical protein
MTDKKKISKKRKDTDPKKIQEYHRKKKPSTKIFDIIGEVLKTPYKIRGGKAKGGLIKGRPKLAKRGF